MDTTTETVLPFGKHRGQPIKTVPDGYLLWLLREAKLSSGLRASIGDELRRRGQQPPPAPPYVPPTCQRCGPGPGVLARWQEDARGQDRIRGTCSRCRRFVCFLPMLPEYKAEADEARHDYTPQEVLSYLERGGVDVRSDGASVLVFDTRELPADVLDLIHEYNHRLAVLMGRTIPVVAIIGGED